MFVSHFEPLGLKCEMTIMPLDRILGRDKGKESFVNFNNTVRIVCP